MLKFIRPERKIADLDWGQTTKVGGVSDFSGSEISSSVAFRQNVLNLATHVQDDPLAVDENWKRFGRASSWSRETIATSQQVHGDEIFEATSGGHHQVHADAIICRQPGLAVGVFTADCVPILVADPDYREVAAIHCGWKGVAANLTGKTISQLVGTNHSRRSGLLVWIGAAIQCDSYEVGPEVASRFDKTMCKRGKPGKFQLDLPKAIHHQLLDADLHNSNIENCSIDTYILNNIVFSYRADAKMTGRMMTFVGFLK